MLVATPGRLIAHLEGTPGFTLHHLRFLIVDETDRLLRQAYQDWLPKVMAALRAAALAGPAGAAPLDSGGGGGGGDSWLARGGEQALPAVPALPAGQLEQQLEQQHQQQWEPRRVVKLVVSATLTRDPSKIDRLDLHSPRYIATSAGAMARRCH